MTTDAIVSAKDMFKAMVEVRRLRRHKVMQELEKLEPDLTEYALEELTAIHHALVDAGVPPRRTRRLSRRIETMVLVLVTALRRARMHLWREAPPAVNGDGIPREEVADPMPAVDRPKQVSDDVERDRTEGKANG